MSIILHVIIQKNWIPQSLIPPTSVPCVNFVINKNIRSSLIYGHSHVNGNVLFVKRKRSDS